MLTVSRLNFDYPGKRVLNDISFNLPRQSVTALVGPNGAGKSTLMRCLSTLLPPFSGEILLDGHNIFAHPRAYHGHIGYLADDFGLYDDLTVQRALIFAAHSRKVVQVEQRVEETAKALGLLPYLAERASRLSRGWRQRLAMAQAIIHRPRLLFLDEPAANLDPEARHGLAELFLSLQRQGMTLLVSSHILSELEAYCDGLLVLREGCIMEHRSLGGSTENSRLLRLRPARPQPGLKEALAQETAISQIVENGEEIRFRLTGGEEAQAELLHRLTLAGWKIAEWGEGKEGLQETYLAHYGQGRAGEKP